MPDNPVGTVQHRITKAIHWHWTTEKTQAEIAEKLGVSETKVREYIRESPTSEAVREQLDDAETTVRSIAVAELQEQLRAAGERSKSAEKPVKIWQNDAGELVVRDQRDDDGQVTGRYPVPQGFRMGADQETRYYARAEVRDTLDLLTDIVGAKEPEQHEVTGAGGGPIEVVINDSIREPDRED